MSRAGRKRKAGIKRQPNGQPSRAKEETAKKARKTAVEARKRLYGLSDEQAAKQDAGTFIGRAVIAGELSVNQQNAAEEYERVVLANAAAIQTPGRVISTSSLAPFDDEAYTKRCRAARARYEDMMQIMLKLDQEQRVTNSLGVLYCAIIQDTDMWHMMGDLRLALNSIHKWAELTDYDERAA